MPRPITIETFSNKKQYDSLPLYNHTYELTEGSLVLDHILNPILFTEIKTPGLVDNITTFDILDGLNMNQTYNYDITIDAGYLEIIPITIEISTPSDTKNIRWITFRKYSVGFERG